MNDIGNDSIYFEVNGKPVVPYLYLSNTSMIQVRNNKLLIRIPVINKSIALEMYISNFQGRGKYIIEGDSNRAVYHPGTQDYFYFEDTLGNLGIHDYYGNIHIYDSIIKPSFLHVLDYDPILNQFQGIFEFYVADTLDAEVHITNGRIILGYD